MPGRLTWFLLSLAALLVLVAGPGCADKKPQEKPSASKSGAASEGRKRGRKKKVPRTPETPEAPEAEALKGAPEAAGAEAAELAEAAPGEAQAEPTGEAPEGEAAPEPPKEPASEAQVPEPAPQAPPAAHGNLPNPALLGPPPPKVEHLLSIADLVAVIHTKGWVTKGAIAGREPDESYNSIQYEKPGTGRLVALQLWKGSREEAVANWNNLLATWPNAQAQENMVTQDTFFWNRGHLFGLVFLDTAKGLVVGVTCHTEICTDTQLLQLTLTAFGRLKK
jgi:hypothetical protein